MASLSARSLAALVALTAAGCSFGTDDPGETVEDFRDAVAAGDVPAACEEIVPDAQVYFYPEPVTEDGVRVGYRNGCGDPGQVELDANARSAASATRVRSSEVSGDTAKVVTETAAQERLVFDLVRIDERWRLKAPAPLLTALDGEAKRAARKAQTAMESYGARNRSYSGAGAADLREIQPVLANAVLSTAMGSGDTYEVGVTSASGTEFTIARRSSGRIASRCDGPGLGGCAPGGAWSELTT